MSSIAIELLKAFFLKNKSIVIPAFAFFFVVLISVFSLKTCDNRNKKAETIHVKPQKYDSTTQKRIDKIDSLHDANIKRINQLQDERLQHEIDRAFKQH